MRIGTYTQSLFPSSSVSGDKAQTLNAKGQTQEGSLFQQLLQSATFDSADSSMKANEVATKDHIERNEHQDDLLTKWVDLLLLLLPADMQQTLHEQFETNPASLQPSSVPQTAAWIKQMLSEQMTWMQSNSAQGAEPISLLEEWLSLQPNRDELGPMINVETLVNFLQNKKAQQASSDPRNGRFSALFNGGAAAAVNTYRNGSYPHQLTFPPSSFSSAFSSTAGYHPDSLAQLTKAANHKQGDVQTMAQPFFNQAQPTLFSQNTEPIISLPENTSANGSSEQLIRQFTSIIKSSKFTNLGNGQSQLVIRLHPEHLGTLTVKLVQENGQMMAKIIASSRSAKELMEANIQQMAHVIPAQHVTIEQFDVRAHSPLPSYEQSFSQHERNREGQPDQEQRQPFEQDKELPFQESFLHELLNIEA